MSQVKRDRSGEHERRKQKCLQFKICLRCSGPSPDKLICDSCLAKRREKRKLRDAARKTAKLCRCGRKPEKGKELCPQCLAIGRKSAMVQRTKHSQEGTCLTCGKPPKPGYSSCEACMSRATSATMKRYTDRKVNGLCPFCGTTLDTGFRCPQCHEGHLKHSKEQHYRNRSIAIQHYGGRCECCGLDIMACLEIDHINNDGCRHRKVIGSHIISWLMQNDYPAEFRVLCSNCNRGRGKFGECPHAVEPPVPNSKHGRKRRRRRLRCIEAYGGKCQNCGESNWAFLEFDHVDDDGSIQRKTVKRLVPWLIRNKFPSNVQLLCSNCNMVKQFYPQIYPLLGMNNTISPK